MHDAPQAPADEYRDQHSRCVPFLELLGVRPVDSSEGRATFELTVDERHLRSLGLLHGGMTATMLDTAMGFAAVTICPEEMHVVTVQLNLNYTRPVKEGETLTATGEIMHAGRKTAVARGELRVKENNALAAAGTGTFMFIPRS